MVYLEKSNFFYHVLGSPGPNAFPPAGGLGGLDLGGLLSNPALMNMATTMLADPNMQAMMGQLMAGGGPPGAGGAAGMPGGMPPGMPGGMPGGMSGGMPGGPPGGPANLEGLLQA